VELQILTSQSTPLFPDNPLPIIEHIHKRNMKAGVAISPDTPSTAITDEIADAVDMLLVMTVYPGKIVLM
jgi:ribulose-phosphate 3-epimerase